MKWIKALEKLPPVGMDCNLKINNVPFSGRYWGAESEHMSHLSYEHFNVAGKSILSVSNFHIIEWLDESASLPSSSVTGEEVNKKMKEAIETLLTAIEFVAFEHSAVYAITTNDIIMLKDAVASLPVTGEEWISLKEYELRVKMPSSVTGESEAKGFAEWACGLYLRIEKDDEGNQWKEKLLGRYYTSQQLYNVYKKSNQASEAIGERKFTLKEALEIHKSGMLQGICSPEEANNKPDEIQRNYFKNKFGIDI